MLSDEDRPSKGVFIMSFLVYVDASFAAVVFLLLSAVSDYCMHLFFREVFLISETALH